MTKQEMWQELKEMHGVCEQTLQVVTDLNGYTVDTLRDILFSVDGVYDFDGEEE